MKTAQISKYGHSEVVGIKQDSNKPAVSANKVLVKVYAAGINPVDWKMREGYLQKISPLQFPATLGGDFSGIIVEVGENVTSFKKGDEVYGQASVLNGGSGTFAEFALANAKSIALKPRHIGHVEAAALPLVGVSAWQALANTINLSPGQKILIHGGTGGIGSIAIQLAKYFGAYVAATVNGENQRFAKELGADEIIDYKNEPFENLIHNFDAVLDTVGGDTYKKSFEVLKKGGILVSMLEQPNAELARQYDVDASFQLTQVTTERLTKLAELIDKHLIKMHIDETFPLDQAGEALAYLQQRHPLGKVVLEVENHPFIAKIKSMLDTFMSKEVQHH